jgi:hypothetical protein
MGTRLRVGLVSAAALALPLTGAGLVAAHATAAPPSDGPGPVARLDSGPDYCTDDSGVTVVVDMSAFGGAVIVRCVDGPLSSGYDGWDALSDAGFSPVAPTRAPGFVCRIAGEPAAGRSLDIPENHDYHEQCVNTPPTSAYWGYWYAPNGGSWTYSSAGAAGHHVIKGGFEGWAFSLNSGAHPPKPGVAPSHPVAPTTTPPTGSPSTGGGGHHHSSGAPTSQGTPTTPPASTGGPGGSGKPGASHHRNHHRLGAGTSAPTDGGPTGRAPTPTSSTDVQVTSDLPAATDEDNSGGSALPTLIGIGVLAIIGAGAGVTGWRRSRRG